MRSTITAACCLAIIAVASFTDKPPKEPTPAPQTLTTLETNVVTPAKSDKRDNPDCACEDCQCDPCECGTVKESLTVDTRPIIYFFTADWCLPCRDLKPLIDQLKADGYRIHPMDVAAEKNAEYVRYYDINSVPQFVVVDTTGKELERTQQGETRVGRILDAIGPFKTQATNFNDSAAIEIPPPQVYSQPRYQVQQPQRTGWFRGRMTRSVCGPGGCR